MREIERKWLVYDDIDLDLQDNKNWTYVQREQLYLSTYPEVRISKKVENENISYKLTIKGEGDIDRIEIEKDLNKQEYELLSSMIIEPPIMKECYYNGSEYRYPIFVSRVDDKWCYVEIEFDNLEESMLFKPLDWFADEITSWFRMRDYFVNRINPWRNVYE